MLDIFFRFSGYTIVQLPEFFRACYLAIKRYVSKNDEETSTQEHDMEIKIIQSNQAGRKNKNLVNKTDKLNLQTYVNSKIEILSKFQEDPTNYGEKYGRKSDLNELIIQEINLLNQLLEKNNDK